jgi:plasmid stabilization system protein ParE
MTRKTLRVQSQAQEEVNQAFEWYFERSPQSAEAFLSEIGELLKRIVAGTKHFPFIT